MSRDASFTEFFGDDHHVFRFGIGQLREVQEKTGTGPEALYVKFKVGTWGIDDMFHVLRLGLIGGGMKPGDAYKLVEKNILPPLQHVPLCVAIMGVALMGPGDDGDEVPKEGGATTNEMQGNLFASPPSTDMVQ